MKVVIIGGGFCGTLLAKELDKKAEVILLDKKDYFEYVPSVHKVILEPEYHEKIKRPFSKILKNTRIVTDKLLHVTPKQVVTEKEKIDFSPALRTLEDIGLVYPVLEVAGEMITAPVGAAAGGLAGLGALATNIAGITDTEPSRVIQDVSSSFTFQPFTEEGKHLSKVANMPFEALSELAKDAGNKVLEETGSPVLATIADVAVNLGPFAALPAGKKVGKKIEETRGPSKKDVKEDTTTLETTPFDEPLIKDGEDSPILTPSYHQIGDEIQFIAHDPILMHNPDYAPVIHYYQGKVIGVHFTQSSVFYDLEIYFIAAAPTIIENVEAAFVVKVATEV